MVIALPSKHLAVIALVPRQKNLTRDGLNMTNIAPTHAGVNVLLGGAMMSCMLIMVVCICYLCHWRFTKAEETRYAAATSDSWLQVNDSDPPVHIFTLEQQCFEGLGLYGGEEEEAEELPPPDYAEVMASDEKSDPNLPSYESALKLSGHGYV